MERVLLTCGVVVGGFLLATIAARFARGVSARKLSPLQATLISRTVFALVLLVTLSMALSLWGLSVAVLFGAAGILTLAVGFASQTSASNLIAGIFLMAERSFSIGDVIQVDGLSGEVISIDLLSLKLRKFDNVLVRIPNEKLIKADVETLTKYAIRRIDFRLTFHPEEDLKAVRALLEAAASKEPFALVEPKPDFVIDAIADGNASGRFSVWSTQDEYVRVRSSVGELALAALRDHGVRLAGQRRTVEVLDRTARASEQSV